MKRIISLVPSLSEAICDLGLEDELVGITNFCTHPKSIWSTKERVGGTKDPDIQKIRDMHPSHILVNAEENKPEHIIQLKEIAEVIETDVKTVADTVEMYDLLGRRLGCEEEAGARRKSIENLIANLKPTYDRKPSITAFYFIWKDPWMCVSRDTYIADVLRYFGIAIITEFNQDLGEAGRYPEIDLQKAGQRGADICLFSSEPWPFRVRDIEAFNAAYDGKREYYKVDGKDFSWYGISTLTVMRKALHFQDEGLNMFGKVEIS